MTKQSAERVAALNLASDMAGRRLDTEFYAVRVFRFGRRSSFHVVPRGQVRRLKEQLGAHKVTFCGGFVESKCDPHD